MRALAVAAARQAESAAQAGHACSSSQGGTPQLPHPPLWQRARSRAWQLRPRARHWLVASSAVHLLSYGADIAAAVVSVGSTFTGGENTRTPSHAAHAVVVHDGAVWIVLRLRICSTCYSHLVP